MTRFARLLSCVAREGAAALVSLTRTEGSTPRGVDAFMIVTPSGDFHGTIGGGALEWDVLQAARKSIADGVPTAPFSYLLGPDLGQCCGGRVRGIVEVFNRADEALLQSLAQAEADPASKIVLRAHRDCRPVREIVRASALDDDREDREEHAQALDREAVASVVLFGAGHVGRALALALANLPFAVRWIDGREGIFPAAMARNVTPVSSADVCAQLAQAPDGALVLAMTHSHMLDFEIVAEALRANRFAYVGLIGSQTKRARFVSRLDALGLREAAGNLTCPIGSPKVNSKLPSVIAAVTAAQLLSIVFR